MCPVGTYEDRAVPTRIKALVGKDIERVAGGQHHTIFLRRDGVVYGCGSCKLGQVSLAGQPLAVDQLEVGLR